MSCAIKKPMFYLLLFVLVFGMSEELAFAIDEGRLPAPTEAMPVTRAFPYAISLRGLVKGRQSAIILLEVRGQLIKLRQGESRTLADLNASITFDKADNLGVIKLLLTDAFFPISMTDEYLGARPPESP